MINLIMGRPGGGKSYEAVVYHIIPAVTQDKRKVITNLPINFEAIRLVFGDEAASLIEVRDFDFHGYGSKDRPFSKPEDYDKEWRNMKGQAPLHVIDEAHTVVGRDCSSSLLEFYAMARHMGIDVLLLTQSDRKLHRDIRDLVEIVYRCIKNTALGSDKTYTKKTNMGCGRTNTVNIEQRRYKKEYFKFYTSHTASNHAVQEAMASDVKPFWKSKLVFSLFVCVLLSVAAIVNLSFKDNIFGGPKPISSSIDHSSVHSSNVDHSSVKKKINYPSFTVDLPLSGFTINVTGYSEQFVKRGNKSEVSSIYYLSLKKGDVITKATSNDLKSIGYDFVRLTDCLYDFTYKGVSVGTVLCDYKPSWKPGTSNLDKNTGSDSKISDVLKSSFS